MYCTLYNKQKITDWWCGRVQAAVEQLLSWLHLTAAATAAAADQDAR